jgi:iron complex outermembrane recepter protein
MARLSALLRLRLPSLRARRMLTVCFSALAASCSMAAENSRRHFDIPAGPAIRTLKRVAQQAGLEIAYSAAVVSNVTTMAVTGDFTPHEALDRMVANTPLKIHQDPQSGALSVLRRTDSEHPPTPPKEPPRMMTRKNPLALVGAWLALALTPGQAAENAPNPAAANSGGELTGTVSNTATRNLLEGAKVELPQLGLSALTDNTGRFVLAGVPPGTHELTVSYIGLDPIRSRIAVQPGQRLVRDFDLTTAIYQMQAFTVTGEREGEAAALTAQRNSTNLQDVVAMDSYGNLPNMSAGEVVMRLPGIAGDPSDEGLAYGFNVRGMAPALNTITIDGGIVPSIGTSRAFELQSITATMFEQLELVKGHTPDTGADSLGGTLNMKTRSPLNMKEKRRLSYSATVRIAPSFTEQVPAREAHRAHPLVNLGYQEVFGVFGGTRNLGVAVNVFYSENAVGGFTTTRDFQNTLEEPAYLWSYRTSENYNNRKQASLNLKTDYRYSFNTKFTLNLTANQNREHFRRTAGVRAWTGTANTVPSATTGIVPGYTDRITQVRPTAGSNIDITANGPNNYDVSTYHADFGAEHIYGPLHLDYNAGLGQTRLEAGNGTGGYLTNRLSNVGWIIDRTEDDLYPKFTQTAGPAMSDPANYRPIANGLEVRPNKNDQKVAQFRGNARYTLPIRMPVSLKTGISWREQSSDLRNASRQWSYIGASALPVYPTPAYFATVKTGNVFPRWDVPPLMRDHAPIDPSLWRENEYFHQQLKYTGTRGVTESVTAGYIMAQGKLARDGLLSQTSFKGGVRRERTEVESYGWVRNRFGTTAAERTADPAGAAARDYANNRREIHGRYTKSFPSLHLTHDVTQNLKARVSWSTSFGRPPRGNLLPNETVNEDNDTVTVNNPNLLPQTAKTWDATLEYYFEPVGSLSVGWFHKTINDYIVTGINSGIISGGVDNGFNGEYEGFRRLTSANAGTAIVQGWEFSYRQQFTFLPGLLRGLSASANYSIINTHGKFAGSTYRTTREIEGFIPRAGNVALNWRYHRFSTRVLYNFTGEHIAPDGYSATSPALNEFVHDRKTVNLGLAYQLRPALSLTCDVSNLFNEPYRVYVGKPDRMQITRFQFVTITFGVTGRF